jgi:hypothetical protein
MKMNERNGAERLISTWSKVKVSQYLESNYFGYRLINFANVIADVLAENTIFSYVRQYSSVVKKIRREIDALKSIKIVLLQKLRKYFVILQDNRAVAEIIHIDQISDDEIIDNFGLRAFHDEIGSKILEREEEISKIMPLVTSSYHRDLFLKSRKPITPVNQLVYFFSMVMFKPDILFEPDGRVTRATYKVKWEDMITLLTWFGGKLNKSVYVKKLYFKRKDDISGWPDTLKVQYSRIGKKFRPALIKYCTNYYFPKGATPFLLDNYSNDNVMHAPWPIMSVVFYRNRIIKKVKGDNGLKVLEYRFDKGKPKEIFRGSSQEIGDNDKKGKILEINYE